MSKILTTTCVYRECLKYFKTNVHEFGTFDQYEARNRELFVPEYHRKRVTGDGTRYLGVKKYNVLPPSRNILELRFFVKK